MNYGKKVDEAAPQGNYLQCGINEKVNIARVVAEKWGDKTVADVFLENGGNEFKWRIFPFNYNANFSNTEEEQEEKYLQNIKHVFSKAVGEENYDKFIAQAKDFDSFIDILSKMSVEKAKANSKPIRLMLIAKKNKDKFYSTMPTWNGGFCEEMSTTPSKLKFDEAKYGMPKKDAAKVEDADSPFGTVSDDLPFN